MAIFDTPEAVKELAALEQQAAAADFWKEPGQAQQVLRRRRRLQEDHELAESLRQKASDLEVLVDWASQGEDVGDDLQASLDALTTEVEAGEVKCFSFVLDVTQPLDIAVTPAAGEPAAGCTVSGGQRLAHSLPEGHAKGRWPSCP